MTFINLIKILKPAYKWILIVSILVTLITGIIVNNKNATIRTDLAVTITRINLQQTSDYKYDGYYAISAVELFLKTFLAWLQSPAIAGQILNEAKIDNQYTSAQLARYFNVSKAAPQLVNISFNAADREKASNIAAAIKTVLQQSIDKQNELMPEESFYAIQFSEPLYIDNKPDYKIASALALVLSLAASTLLAFIWLGIKKQLADENSR